MYVLHKKDDHVGFGLIWGILSPPFRDGPS